MNRDLRTTQASTMRVFVSPSPQAAAEKVAELLRLQIEQEPDTVLGLPTGRTPQQLYAELVRLHREEGLDFSRVTTFNLDEYLGIGPDDPGSFHQYMRLHLFAHVNLDDSRTHIPDGRTPNPAKSCRHYEELIRKAGGIDIQVLGLGRNGHIGFNEPGSPLASRTRVETLTAQTRKDNAEVFSGYENVPEQAITMGMATILEARRIFLLVFGAAKAEIVQQAIEGPVTPMLPASALQMHPDTTVFLDEEAARRLDRSEPVADLSLER